MASIINDAVLSGLSVLLGGGLTLAGNKLKEFAKRRKKPAPVEAIINAADVISEMNELANVVHADSVLLLFTSNGGGIPTASAMQYVTILYEVIRSRSLEPIRNDWQRIPLDNGYTNMLKKLISEGQYDTLTSDMDPGMFKDLYESEGIVQTHIVPIVTTERRFFYLSIRWTSERDVSDAVLNTNVKGTKYKLQNLLKSSFKERSYQISQHNS